LICLDYFIAFIFFFLSEQRDQFSLKWVISWQLSCALQFVKNYKSYYDSYLILRTNKQFVSLPSLYKYEN
jgi:hypothetical protein